MDENARILLPDGTVLRPATADEVTHKLLTFGPVELAHGPNEPSDYDAVTYEEWATYCANDCAPEFHP